MTDALLTAADLAERLRLTESQVLELRRRHSWPCVAFSRKTIRFTESQAAQIVDLHARSAEVVEAPALPVITGQTKASQRRRAS